MGKGAGVRTRRQGHRGNGTEASAQDESDRIEGKNIGRV